MKNKRNNKINILIWINWLIITTPCMACWSQSCRSTNFITSSFKAHGIKHTSGLGAIFSFSTAASVSVDTLQWGLPHVRYVCLCVSLGGLCCMCHEVASVRQPWRELWAPCSLHSLPVLKVWQSCLDWMRRNLPYLGKRSLTAHDSLSWQFADQISATLPLLPLPPSPALCSPAPHHFMRSTWNAKMNTTTQCGNGMEI